MSTRLELSCGITREVFDLRKVDWSLTIYSGVRRAKYTPTKFNEIIDQYQHLISYDPEHMANLWKWVALHPYCNVRIIEE